MKSDDFKCETLVDAKGLLAALFAEDCRPSVRWLRDQQKRRTIPFVKWGALVRFDVEQVREAIAKDHTILPRSLGRRVG